MNKELNAKMATEVMGCHKWDMNEKGVWVWVKDRKFEYFLPNNRGDEPVWNPTEDMNQAMMCLAKAEVELFGILRDKNFKEGAKFLVEGTHCTLEELPLTICEAIMEAVRDEK